MIEAGMISREEALKYHSEGRKGKIEVVPTKPCGTQKELSLAYTPGVAEPCLEIEKDPKKSYSYTARGNLVAVVTNGTAVLGLGNIGPHAAKPVMEGKGVLFKKFADIDVFDIEIDAPDPVTFVSVVKALEPDAKTKSGLVVPDTAKEKPQEGRVLSVGTGRLLEDGVVQPLQVKSGDRILYGKYSGTEITLGGEEYLILREDDVLAVVQ
jgi:co-chaperonin GroES (HSP10)